MNKRPRGTTLLEDQDRLKLIDELKKKQQDLETAQARMSVTHFTQRAKNQYVDFVHKTQALEDSLRILERKRFVMIQ
mgnify:CR=1 FL=1